MPLDMSPDQYADAPQGPPPPQADGQDDGQSQVVEMLHMAWLAGKQGMPFEQFMQHLMSEAGGDDGGEPAPQGPGPDQGDMGGM